MVAAVKEGGTLGTLTVAVGRLSRHPLLVGGGRGRKDFFRFIAPRLHRSQSTALFLSLG